ncbi:hypothetical protein MMC18_001310 [Xylographa bjoerkii]|nr:hypothetical protein [Xylographa bjoerkii]
MAAQPTSDHSPSLKADYASPTGTHQFEHSLKALPVQFSTVEKTAYLSALRSSVTHLQEEVNSFLTAKMEEDKAVAAPSTGAMDDKKEEENYGEEVVEDEALRLPIHQPHED